MVESFTLQCHSNTTTTPLHTTPTPPPPTTTHHQPHHPTPPYTTQIWMNNQIIFSIYIFVTRPWSGSICGVLCAAAQSVSEYQLAEFVCLFVLWAGIRSLQTNSPVAVAIAVIFFGWIE